MSSGACRERLTGIAPKAVAIAVGALLSSCGGAIDVTIHVGAALPSGPVYDPRPQALPFGAIALDGSTAINEINKALANHPEIHAARLKGATLSVVAPANATLDFLSSASFELSGADVETVSLARTKPIAPGATAVDLEVEPVNILPYLRASSVKIPVSAVGTLPARITQLDASLTVELLPDAGESP